MSFRKNLIHARSHLIFLGAVICGLVLVTNLEKDTKMEQAAKSEQKTSTVAFAGQVIEQSAIATLEAIEPLPMAPRRPSTAADIAFAKTAWRYFENNTNADTGLVNSANRYPSTTMWETGSYFVAVISAQLLEVIDKDEAQARLSLALDTLAQIKLYDGILPNKAYNVQSGALVDYSNKPSDIGLGWSALDIARIAATFGLIEAHHPELSPKIAAILSRWDLDRMVRDGQLIGGNIANGALREDQEGRVGYEQYAAKAMMLFGFDMFDAYDVNEDIMVKDVEGQPIPVDTRMHRNTIPAFVVSEPYLFDGLEFGFDARSRKFASAIYRAQEARFQSTGQLTAVSETHLSEAPYFAYSSVWGGGAPWAVLSFKGERLDSRRTISTKAAFGWDALFQTEYTAKLLEALTPLGDPENGFPEGIYEIDGKPNSSVTANTNAVVLASLAFRVAGPLLHAAP